MRTRSFRNEDYNNRRAFLRSYPLYGGGDQDEDVKAESEKAAANETTSKKPMKKIILSVFHWGGERVLVLRRFKHKVTFYVVTCLPVGLKAPTALISV